MNTLSEAYHSLKKKRAEVLELLAGAGREYGEIKWRMDDADYLCRMEGTERMMAKECFRTLSLFDAAKAVLSVDSDGEM